MRAMNRIRTRENKQAAAPAQQERGCYEETVCLGSSMKHFNVQSGRQFSQHIDIQRVSLEIISTFTLMRSFSNYLKKKSIKVIPKETHGVVENNSTKSDVKIFHQIFFAAIIER